MTNDNINQPEQSSGVLNPSWNKEELNGILDSLISQINSTYNDLLSAMVMYNLGQDFIHQINDDAFISPKVGVDLNIEPILIYQIKSFKDKYPYFLLEVFHGKIVHIWNDCLNNIFSLLIQLHLTGIRKFEALKKRYVKLDFSSNNDFYLQIREKIIDDFKFWEYSERQNLINKILNPTKKKKKELFNVHKNVLVRNTLQHRNGIVDSYILNRLGVHQIEMLDMEGISEVYQENDNLLLSFPEIHTFKQSILNISQVWRIEDD